MCALCGVLMAEQHWSDPAARPTVFDKRHAPPTRRRERLERVAIANEVLSVYGLKLSDWQGQRFVLANRTGQSEIVEHLIALWPAAEQLAKKSCDPLDPALLNRLESKS